MLDAQSQNKTKTVRLMFEDEAGFGRINKPKRCWCPKGQRPSVPCHHIREYRYAFGAVEPLSGESFFLTMPNCDTECTNIFLEKLSEQYPDDIILLVCDGAAWHKSKALRCPENIQLLSIPPYTSEVKTTGEAGGLIRPCKGLLPASANRAPKIWQSHLYYWQPPSSGGSFTFFSFN